MLLKTQRVKALGEWTAVDKFIAFHSIVLIGLVLMQRGFAYIGVAPLFIGEIALLIGLGIFMWTGGAAMIFRGWTTTVLSLFMIWGALQTIPYIPTYGMAAIRDANLWWYALWAFVVGGMLLTRPLALAWLVRNYAKFAMIVLPGALLCFVIRALFQPYIPFVYGSQIQFIDIRPNNTMVHIAGIIAYLIAGLGGQIHWFWTLLVPVHMVTGGTASRGGLVALVAAMGTALFMRPRSRWGWGLIGSMGLAVVLLIGLDIRIQGFWYREISGETLVNAFASLIGDSGNTAGEEITKQWRLNWWKDIVNYTFHGPYGWTGKGFGVNLAASDGNLVAEDLRSPHNGHINILARMGVPGLTLWALLNAMWAFRVFDGWFRARREGDWKWAGLFIVLLAYWIAILVNAAFDVYLEGPMGGIWFWTIFGVGLAATRLHRECPQALYLDELLAMRGIDTNRSRAGARRPQYA